MFSLSAQLKLGNELLTVVSPFLGPREVGAPLNVTFDFPLSPEAITTIDATRTQPSINLNVLVSEVQLVMPGEGQLLFVSETPAGEWAEEPLLDTAISLNIPVRVASHTFG